MPQPGLARTALLNLGHDARRGVILRRGIHVVPTEGHQIPIIVADTVARFERDGAGGILTNPGGCRGRQATRMWLCAGPQSVCW
jgi:hypothetical protein